MPVPYPKPEPKPKNPGKKARTMTSERLRLEGLKREAYERIANEREPFCAGCGKPEWEHSHRLPQNFSNYRYIAVDENIDLYCRLCHGRWEQGTVWKLENGQEAMEYLLRADKGYFLRKLKQMDDRMGEELNFNDALTALQPLKVVFPEWAIKMVVRYL